MSNLLDNVTPLQIQENLNQTFDYTKISNCILEAPNGIYSINGRTLTIKAGVKYLVPNGRNADGTLNNLIVTLLEDVVINVTLNVGYYRNIFFNENGQNVRNANVSNTFYYKSSSNLPSTMAGTANAHAYCEDTNYWYFTSGSTTANWQVETALPLLSIYLDTVNTMVVDTNVNPVKLINTEMANGRWISKSTTLAGSWTAAPTTADVEYDLTSYLPKDSYNYQVLVSAAVRSGNATGNYILLYLATDLIGSTQITGVTTRANSYMWSCGGAILPVGLERSLNVYHNSYNTGSYLLYLRAYRRVGING